MTLTFHYPRTQNSLELDRSWSSLIFNYHWKYLWWVFLRALYRKLSGIKLFVYTLHLLLGFFFFLRPCHIHSVNTWGALWSNFGGDQRKGRLWLPGFKSSDVQTSNETSVFIRAAAVTQTTRQPQQDVVYLMPSWFIFATGWTLFFFWQALWSFIFNQWQR